MTIIRNNILQFLEAAAEEHGDRTAYVDSASSSSFREVYDSARAVGSYIASVSPTNRPIAVLMDKSIPFICAMLGAVYAGCFYVPLDYKMTTERLNGILSTLEPELIIFDSKTEKLIPKLSFCGRTVKYDDAVNTPVNEPALSDIRRRYIDTDLLYVIFTSGSTGVPKGVTISQRSAVQYLAHITNKLELNGNDRIANSVPLFFDMSLMDVYGPFYTGCTTYLLPRTCFIFPSVMAKYLNDNMITVLNWVPASLINFSSSGILKEEPPLYLRCVLFGAERMPTKYLNEWRRALPDTVTFINGYGPTEASDITTLYFVDREFDDDEPIPLGEPMPNTRIYLLDDNNAEVAPGETGEICITGSYLSFGYYNDPEKTRSSFVQNPFNTHYHEQMYRTGDLAYRNGRGELIYLGRKDSQIKLNGYRIELGEIEHAASSAAGVADACCLFNADKKLIILLYTGTPDEKAVQREIKARLPHYMVPSRIVKIDSMPRTANGKLDRTALKKQYAE